MATKRTFPNESPAYRAARDKLLDAEVELRAQIERVAEQRRSLPLGGKVNEDYPFQELVRGAPWTVKLSELFPAGKDTLFLYSFMYGPRMEQPCALCTSFLDGLNAQAPHLGQRLGVAVVAKASIERVTEFAMGRQWHNLRMVSSGETSYHADYLGEDEQGNQLPMANVFVQRPDGIYHSWGSELLHREMQGGDSRHLDALWPLWNILDLTPAGRGADWYPRLSYEQ